MMNDDHVETNVSKSTGRLLQRAAAVLMRSFCSLPKIIMVAIIALVFTVPYLWLIGSTFRTREELFAYIYPLTWRTFIPLQPTLINFKTLFVEYNFATPLLNSLGISIVSVVIGVILCSTIAFVLAWIEFPGREIVFVVILATMLIAFEAKLVPLFLIMEKLNIGNTYFSIFAPWLVDAYFIFLLRQHFKGIPQELFDAAILDGCSYFRVYWSVMMPNIKPALMTMAFIKFMFSWDSYIWPLITIRDESKTVITVAIAKLFSDDTIIWEIIFSSAFVATIPIIILFMFLQRYYIQGITTSGLKG